MNRRQFKSSLYTVFFTVWAITYSGASVSAENNLKISGALVAEPCIITPGTENLSVNFGSVTDSDLKNNGKSRIEVFSIRLESCETSMSSRVDISFTGQESTIMPGLIALAPGSGASGVAIGLENEKGEIIKINKPVSKELINGINEITFKAYLKNISTSSSASDIKTGSVKALVNFGVSYP